MVGGKVHHGTRGVTSDGGVDQSGMFPNENYCVGVQPAVLVFRGMNADLINEAVIVSVSEAAIPRVDRQKLLDRYGESEGSVIADHVIALVREAVAMPIDWGTMTFAEGVDDIVSRFSQLHPELSSEALEEIGRCVAWQLR